MVMVAFQSSYSQGVYGLVSNLGSLVVRTIFQVPSPHLQSLLVKACEFSLAEKPAQGCELGVHMPMSVLNLLRQEMMPGVCPLAAF